MLQLANYWRNAPRGVENFLYLLLWVLYHVFQEDEDVQEEHNGDDDFPDMSRGPGPPGGGGNFADSQSELSGAGTTRFR